MPAALRWGMRSSPEEGREGGREGMGGWEGLACLVSPLQWMGGKEGGSKGRECGRRLERD